MSKSITLNQPRSLEDQYFERLSERVEQWALKHPTSYEAIRRAILVRHHALYTIPDPESLLGKMVDTAAHEEVRKLKGWPSYRQWAANQKDSA